MRLWDDGAGSYHGAIRDGRKTAPTAYAAMMCLYFDVVPPERKDRVNQWLLANYDKESLGPYAHMYSSSRRFIAWMRRPPINWSWT